MQTLEFTGQIGTNAVKSLRIQKLRQGLPFMINAKELSTNQCYLEYPDGSIKLIAVVSSAQDINIIRELSAIEAEHLRTRFNFSDKK